MQQVNPETTTGNTTLDTLLTIVGALYTILTALAALPLPKGLSLVQFAARLGADLRNVRKAGSTDGDDGAVSKTLPGLLLLLAIPGCGLFEESIVPTVEGCAPGRAYVIENLESILDGEKPFDVLDRIKNEKGREFVMCALQSFVAAHAKEAVAARAYIEREALSE